MIFNVLFNAASSIQSNCPTDFDLGLNAICVTGFGTTSEDHVCCKEYLAAKLHLHALFSTFFSAQHVAMVLAFQCPVADMAGSVDDSRRVYRGPLGRQFSQPDMSPYVSTS